nr:MMPL family transporter [Mycobacterium spongiae]
MVIRAPTIVCRPSESVRRTCIPRTIRRLAVPIILAWVATIAALSVLVPPLEKVGAMRAVSMSPHQAPSMIAMRHIGDVFEEFSFDSSVMIVLEGRRELGDDTHRFYARLVDKLEADAEHVEHVQDFWGDPLTEVGAQSADGRAAYVQVYLVGNLGENSANDSVRAVRDIVASIPAPDGVQAYVAGRAALDTDRLGAGSRSLRKIEGVTFVVITVMLLLVYWSIATAVVVLTFVALSLFAARGVVAFLSYHELFGLSIFATNLLVTLAIAASTDYAIFLVGRYQEARGTGEDSESAFFTMFSGTAGVVLGSGLTIAGATFCLHFTRLPYFQTLAIPLAIGMVVVVFVALTLGCAIVTVASRFSLLEPKRQMRIRGWRKIGAAVVRWPGPILVATTVLSLVGLLALPGYRTNYNDRNYIPADLPANVGYAAADRHFPKAKINPEALMVEGDRDLRNPAGFLIIERIAKAVLRVEGIAQVQAITRPQGIPIKHTSIPFQMSMQGTTQVLNMPYMQDRMDDMLVIADEMQEAISIMEVMLDLLGQLTDTTDSMTAKMHKTVTHVGEVRDRIADFDDFFRPLRSYFYWEQHCYDIPLCWSLRSVFESLDGVDTLTEDMQSLLSEIDRLDALMPQMRALLPPLIAIMKTIRRLFLTMRSSMKGLQDQVDAMLVNATAMGQAFDNAMNDDSFYLPPEAFENEELKRGMEMFLSPDGHAVRFIISHENDPMTPQGLSHIDAITTAAREALKSTPLTGARISLAGTGSVYRDISYGNRYDLMIAGLAALGLIFTVMLLMTRAVVAAVVIVGTVVLSLGTSFGLSVLVWQYILGIELHWLVLAMSVIILLAVGADYNLLLVSRLKEEIRAGLKTGMIRAMGGSGSVVTAAGLVFAFTMMSMVVSDLTVIGQVGTTIGLGLLFDMLVVRAFMTPSCATLLGRWFWWPQMDRTRSRADN